MDLGETPWSPMGAEQFLRSLGVHAGLAGLKPQNAGAEALLGLVETAT